LVRYAFRLRFHPTFPASGPDNRRHVSVKQGERIPLRRAAIAGLAGSAAATIIAGVLHTIANAVEFPPLAIAQAVVRAASGQVESFFVQRIGYWGERLAVIGTTTAFLLSGLVLGIVVSVAVSRRRPPFAVW